MLFYFTDPKLVKELYKLCEKVRIQRKENGRALHCVADILL